MLFENNQSGQLKKLIKSNKNGVNTNSNFGNHDYSTRSNGLRTLCQTKLINVNSNNSNNSNNGNNGISFGERFQEKMKYDELEQIFTYNNS